MPRIDRVLVGEALVGEGREVAHIDLVMGPRGSPAESAFVSALTSQRQGAKGLLAMLGPNLICKPATVIFNKLTIRSQRQAHQMWGPAQRAVATAVAHSVRDGVIPIAEAEDVFLSVGVFLHWEAEDDELIHRFNYEASLLAIRRAVTGSPSAADMLKALDEGKV